MVGVSVPLQDIERYSILPAARPKGVMIRDHIEYTSSGLTSKYYSKVLEGKGKENMVEVEKFKPLTAVQMQIYLLLEEVNEIADIKTKFYDE